MKIIIAPDSFKESLSAKEAAEAMHEGARQALPDAGFTLLPLADGGEGTLEVLAAGTGGTLYPMEVTGPLGHPVKAKYGILGDGKTAVVEMAQASGLGLVPRTDRNPLAATTFGTGELIRTALAHPVNRLIVTLGGSATNDAGAGMLQALGVALTGEDGRGIGAGGGALRGLHGMDFSGLDSRLKEVELTIASDVNSPLTGPQGASRVFGPQKGADPDTVKMLEEAVSRFADIAEAQTGTALHHVPGAGAAGGLGGALLLCGGRFQSGIDLVLDTLKFDRHLDGADAVLTGEGRIDSQTENGKTISGVIGRSRRRNVPVIAFAGSVSPGYEGLYARGLQSVHGIVPYPCSLDQALREGKANLSRAVENVLRSFRKS